MSIWHLGADLIEVILSTAALAQNVAAAYLCSDIFSASLLCNTSCHLSLAGQSYSGLPERTAWSAAVCLLYQPIFGAGALSCTAQMEVLCSFFFSFRVTLYTSCLLLNIGKSYLALQLFAESYLPSETNNHFIWVHAGLFVSQHYRQFSFH